MTARLLIIVTSHARMGDSDKPTGLWLEELAAPYYAFRDAGLDITLASPAGGNTPFDPSSIKPAGSNPPAVERFLADADAMALAAQAKPLATLNPADFDAVFFPGGHGTMWDLPDNPAVRLTVETLFAANKVVAAVCHGPAGLVSARQPDGRSILAGRRVSGFTDSEETAAGLHGVVPFMLEQRMRELGGLFERAPDWQSFAVRDGNLITGQNPASSEAVAEAVLAALGSH